MVNVLNLEGKTIKKIKLPKVFETPLRRDIIKKAFIAAISRKFQPKGVSPLAGRRTSAKSLGTGLDLARVPRIKGERYPKAGHGAAVTSTVGGRRAHAPTTQKKLIRKINKKENMLAIASAIAATGNKELVSKRGHKFEDKVSFPIIISDELQKIKTTKEVVDILRCIGLLPDLERVKNNIKIRAGKGKMRGRKYKVRKGPLIVISQDLGIGKAASNIPGVDVMDVKKPEIEKLAPGSHPGRLTVWTESAIKSLSQMFGK